MEGASFQFFLNQKKHVAVLSFVGKAERKDVSQLAKCYDVLAELQCRFVVLNFTGVPQIHEDLNPALVRIQGIVRESGKTLVVCGFNAGLKKKLLRRRDHSYL